MAPPAHTRPLRVSGPRDFSRFFREYVVGNAASLARSSDYLAAHAFLPPDPRAVPLAEIQRRGLALFDPAERIQAKKATLVLLAHHGSPTAVRFCQEYAGAPDEGMATFAELALEEAALWAGLPGPVAPKGSCPCASRRPYKECCGKD